MKVKRIFLMMGVAALLSAHIGYGETTASFSVDWRGLPNVEGIVRENSKANWGFVNFVAFGPGWQYTAQDYAAKEHKKEACEDPKYGKGLKFTAKIWAGKIGLSIHEEFYDVSKGGLARTYVRWTITSLNNAPMELERAYLRFPLSRAEFAGGTVAGKILPMEYGEEWMGVGDQRKIEIVSKDGKKILRASVMKGKCVIQDARKDKQDRFEFRIDFPDAKTAVSSTVEFEVEGAFADSLKKSPGKVKLDLPPPPTKITAGEEWVEFPYTNEIQPGSILDFSKILRTNHAPAGKYGFAVAAKDGHFNFAEKPGKSIRFIGGNLCFDANFLSKEECKRLVADFVRRGWNTVRFHHIDVTITKDEWNKLWERTTYPEISPEKLDQLDYLLAEFKKAGVYATFDLYAMGCLGSCEGFAKPLNSNTIKAVVPIHQPAEDLWFKRAMEIFDHTNPYTGLKWKDDSAILFVTLMNEDSIASVWWGAADLYVKKYHAWAEKKGYPKFEKKGIGSHKEFAEFLYEVKAEANRRMAKRLRDAGVKTLISGGNWWDTAAQAYEREALDVVDNHGYGDHPQPSYQKLPFHINQTSDIKLGNPTYGEPIMKSPTRILGKPFTITEYNYCNPNRYRADGGLVMGAYASLQDWDALYRFAWSHSRSNLFTPSRACGFDIVTDPIGQLTERQIVLLFGRGDVASAKNTYGFGVTKDAAHRSGLGDMWAKGLFPHPFTQLAYTSKTGSFVADGGKKPALTCAKIWTEATRNEIPKYSGKTVSDTNEITIDTKIGDMLVNTPKTAAVCSIDCHDLTAGPLAVKGATTFCNVSASAMDKFELVNSERVLILHITDVLNTGATFTKKNMNDLSNWGKLPYLAKVGEAKVTLKSEVKGMKLWALKSDGSRLREVPASYANGAYSFMLSIDRKHTPTMMYELSK